METSFDLNEMNDQIQRLKAAAENLGRMGDQFPALSRNISRIQAGIKMLELNISDVVSLDPSDPI